MIQSMTGYGKSIVQLPSKKITIELKSLNSKTLDINARLPQTYREKELELRKMIADALEGRWISACMWRLPGRRPLPR